MANRAWKYVRFAPHFFGLMRLSIVTILFALFFGNAWQKRQVYYNAHNPHAKMRTQHQLIFQNRRFRAGLSKRVFTLKYVISNREQLLYDSGGVMNLKWLGDNFSKRSGDGNHAFALRNINSDNHHKITA